MKYREITLEEKFKRASQAVWDNSEAFEAFKQSGGMRWLTTGEHILALVDPNDEPGHAFVQLAGLQWCFTEPQQALQDTVMDMARNDPSPRLRDVATRALTCVEFKPGPGIVVLKTSELPTPIQDCLKTPGPLGTLPVLVAANGVFGIVAWYPEPQGVA